MTDHQSDHQSDQQDDRSFPAELRVGARWSLVATVLGFVGVVTLIGLLTVPGRPWWVTDQERSRQSFELSLRHDRLDFAAEWIGHLTVPTVLRVVTLLGAVLLWRRGRKFAALWWAATMVVAGAVAIGLRYAVARPRPHWPGSGPLVEGYTFPSGHATNAAVFAGCLLVVFWPYLHRLGRISCAVGGLALTLGVAASRVLLGVHHISDVLAAWALAVALLAFMVAIAPLRGHSARWRASTQRTPSQRA